MLPLRFRVALFNHIGTGPFEFPGTVSDEGIEWLIVERIGDHLLVSDASPNAVNTDRFSDAQAPDNLRANNTQVGIRIETQRDTGALVFLLLRHLPDGLMTQGTFFPADGYARLGVDPDGYPRLEAHGRHYHRVRQNRGISMRYDAGVPLVPDAPGALNWHFNATHRPWIGEQL